MQVWRLVAQNQQQHATASAVMCELRRSESRCTILKSEADMGQDRSSERITGGDWPQTQLKLCRDFGRPAVSVLKSMM